MAKALIWATGLFFIIYGAAFMFAPLAMTTFVTGGAPDTPSAVMDLRATYGGMTMAVGAIMLILGTRATTQSLALLVIALVLLAMAAGRVLGMFLDGEPNTMMYIYLAVEIVGGALR